MSFEVRFIELCQERDLFPRERNRVLVACSGGPDSLLLMYLLWRCREELRLELGVLTCDHGLRAESAEEAGEVQKQAWSLGLPCKRMALQVPQRQRQGESIEMAARRLRREAYRDAAREFSASRVALGQHLDDQAETLLLKWSRGTGPRGAAGIQWISELDPGVDLVRPLLYLRRREIHEQCRLWGLVPVLDPGNYDRGHLRNRVRHEVIPLLEERLNPAVVRNLARFAEQQQKLEAWASAEAERHSRECRRGDTLRLEPWRFLPEVLRQRIVLGWLRDAGGDCEAVSHTRLQQFLEALSVPVPYHRRWSLAGLDLRVDADELRLDRPVEAGEVSCEFPGEYRWEPLDRAFRISEAARVDPGACLQSKFDQLLTAFVRTPPDGQHFHLRIAKPGDRYAPLGLNGTVKLSEWFVNRHVPKRLRECWPVVVCGEEIVWVPGGRVAETWKVEKGPCVRLQLAPCPDANSHPELDVAPKYAQKSL